MEAITRAFFAYADKKGEIFERITCTVPYENMQARLTDEVMTRHGSEASSDPGRSILVAYIRESTLSIYRQWIADGKHLSIDEISDLAVTLICHGTEGFQEIGLD